MRQRVVYFVMIWVAVTSVSAQEAKKWTLDDCIDYALEKNIQLQQDKISLEESSVDVKTAKAALFPSLSFSTGQNVTNRPYQETSNTVSGTEIISSDSKTTYNGNYGLNAQWTLWNGNKRLNAIKQKKTGQQIAGLTVAETENSLQEQIAQIFIQLNEPLGTFHRIIKRYYTGVDTIFYICFNLRFSFFTSFGGQQNYSIGSS